MNYKQFLGQILLVLMLFCGCNSNKKSNSTPANSHEILQTKPFEIANLYQYFHKNPVTQFQKEENSIIDFAASKELPMLRSESGLYYNIIATGSGPKIKRKQSISAHYTGKHLSGSIFDSSYPRETPITFQIGEMIAGWNEVVQYMRKGDKAQLLVPSHLAYKDRGMPGYVEPNEVLYFELEIVELVNIE